MTPQRTLDEYIETEPQSRDPPEYRLQDFEDFFPRGEAVYATRAYEKGILTLPEEIIATARAEIRRYDTELTGRALRNEAILEILYDIEHTRTCYSPVKEDIATALRCELVPFFLDGTFFLATGEVGRDDIQHYDCYQALVSGTVSPDSSMLNDRDYPEHLLGKSLVDEALLNCQQTYTPDTRVADDETRCYYHA